MGLGLAGWRAQFAIRYSLPAARYDCFRYSLFSILLAVEDRESNELMTEPRIGTLSMLRRYI